MKALKGHLNTGGGSSGEKKRNDDSRKYEGKDTDDAAKKGTDKERITSYNKHSGTGHPDSGKGNSEKPRDLEMEDAKSGREHGEIEQDEDESEKEEGQF